MNTSAGTDTVLVWSDFWVLECLRSYRGQEVDLAQMIRMGDFVNRAIFNYDELNNGIYRLEAAGLIRTEGKHLWLSENAIDLLRRFASLQPHERMKAIGAELGSVPYGTPAGPELLTATENFFSKEDYDDALEEYRKRSSRGCVKGCFLGLIESLSR